MRLEDISPLAHPLGGGDILALSVAIRTGLTVNEIAEIAKLDKREVEAIAAQAKGRTNGIESPPPF